MKAENVGNGGYSGEDSAEHEGNPKAHRSFRLIWEKWDSATPDLLEKVLDRNNMNNAYKKVKANKGSPGIDGMTVKDALPYLKEHGQELRERIARGKYSPSPVRRVEIPKPNGKKRLLGIPTVVDRVVQEAMTLVLEPIYEGVFLDESYAYRPGKKQHDAVFKVRDYANEGYRYAVDLDLTAYFDNINHDLLLQFLRKVITDERVIQIVKRFLKIGVMINGVVMDTDTGSPQGGPLSPLLANIYLNEFDHELAKKGVKFVRYADDIVLLAKSKRAAERLLENSVAYLEGKLKLKVNREKSRIVTLGYCGGGDGNDFRFLGFTLGKGKDGFYIRIHKKSITKFVDELRRLSSRKVVQSLSEAFKRIRRCAQGWLNYYKIASMKSRIEEICGWLRRRIRMCIWNRWKRVRTKVRNLMKFGISEYEAHMAANCSRGKWFCAQLPQVNKALNNKRLERNGYYDLSAAYQSMHENY
ncbi:MAG: group II intron reverse transcriptase/maturase [Clostridia bacterium]|nr:group II intron reverse transcriptase/maturase [Clostridia bacterium]